MAIDVNAALDALPGFPELATPRLRLRAARDGDTAALFRLYSDDRVMAHWPRPAMVHASEAAGLVVEDAERFEDRDQIGWVIARRSDDHVVGTCSLHGFDRRARRALVGYALHPAEQGRGLAREAVARVLDFGFGTLGLATVEAEVERGNAASRRLLRALGFQVAREVTDAGGHSRYRLERAPMPGDA